ncbi:MAG: HAD-IC family P-type ATPase, partial [Candidatus Kapaibacterium sp.]
RSMGHEVAIGSLSFIQTFCELPDLLDGIAAYVAIDGEYSGAYIVKPKLRKGISEMIAKLHSKFSLRLISGDNARDRGLVEPLFGLQNISFEQTPHNKIAAIEQAREKGEAILMIGDGLNDAGAMNAADVAIAVTDDTATLVPACDAIVRADTLAELPALLQYARTMRSLIIAALSISILYNAAGLTFAAMGLLSPMFAAILMPTSSITVIGISALGARYFAGRAKWQ